LSAGSGGYLVTGISSLKHRTQHISLHPEHCLAEASPQLFPQVAAVSRHGR